MEEGIQIGTIIGIVGSVASIAGLLVAVIQTRNLRALKKRKNKGTWMAIGGTSHLYLKLNELSKNSNNPYIDSMKAQVLNLYRALLMEAAMDEKKFSSSTIQTWLKGGRIKEWEVDEALKFVPTENMNMPKKALFQIEEEI